MLLLVFRTDMAGLVFDDEYEHSEYELDCDRVEAFDVLRCSPTQLACCCGCCCELVLLMALSIDSIAADGDLTDVAVEAVAEADDADFFFKVNSFGIGSISVLTILFILFERASDDAST